MERRAQPGVLTWTTPAGHADVPRLPAPTGRRRVGTVAVRLMDGPARTPGADQAGPHGTIDLAAPQGPRTTFVIRLPVTTPP